MTHGIRIYIDNFYIDGNTPAAGYWETVDATLYAAVNGDGGGTWNPTSPMNIGGAGMIFAGPSTLAGGASMVNLVGSGTRFTLNDNDYVQLATGHTGATRVLLTQFSEGVDLSDFTSSMQGNSAGAVRTAIASGTLNGSPRILLPIRVHNGAKLTQVVFSFKVASSHTNPPAILPLFRIYAMAVDGTITPLSTASTNTGAGFQSFTPKPGSGSAWYDGGATQTFTYTLDANVRIDTSQYAYFAEVIDENGSNSLAGNIYYGVQCTMTGITDQRPQ